jgi:hypothetical protein
VLERVNIELRDETPQLASQHCQTANSQDQTNETGASAADVGTTADVGATVGLSAGDSVRDRPTGGPAASVSYPPTPLLPGPLDY